MIVNRLIINFLLRFFLLDKTNKKDNSVFTVRPIIGFSVHIDGFEFVTVSFEAGSEVGKGCIVENVDFFRHINHFSFRFVFCSLL